MMLLIEYCRSRAWESNTAAWGKWKRTDVPYNAFTCEVTSKQSKTSSIPTKIMAICASFFSNME